MGYEEIVVPRAKLKKKKLSIFAALFLAYICTILVINFPKRITSLQSAKSSKISDFQSFIFLEKGSLLSTELLF